MVQGESLGEPVAEGVDAYVEATVRIRVDREVLDGYVYMSVRDAQVLSVSAHDPLGRLTYVDAAELDDVDPDDLLTSVVKDAAGVAIGDAAERYEAALEVLDRAMRDQGWGAPQPSAHVGQSRPVQGASAWVFVWARDGVNGAVSEHVVVGDDGSFLRQVSSCTVSETVARFVSGERDGR